MLQWMGGGRRKMKTTKKSIQARLHQFFEQRRQQLRSQAAEELISHKISQPHENVYSLDIASLKNLSKLAPPYADDQSEGTKNTPSCTLKPGCTEEVGKAKCFEKDAGVCQNSDLHGTGYAIKTTLDAAAHSRATVGTQWTPASAAAAAALSQQEPVVCPKEPFAAPREDLQAEVIDKQQQEKLCKVHVNPKQEKTAKNNLGPKKPSRHPIFEKFEILDLINSSHGSAQRKKDAHSEHYAAYVLEGMGHVANCTPKNSNVGGNKTRNKDFGPACKSKQGRQQLPYNIPKKQDRREKGKVHLQRHCFSTVDEERGSLTDLESFADSNGEQCSGECHPREGYSLRDLQYPGEMSTRSISHNLDPHLDHFSGRTSLKERDILSLDYIAKFPSPVYNIGSSYPKSLESPPETIGFAFKESDLFSICSDYGSTNISYDMDDYMSCDFFQNDDEDGCSNQRSDGMPSFQFRDCNDEILLTDEFSSPDIASPPLLFEKVKYSTDAILLSDDDSSSLYASPSFSFM